MSDEWFTLADWFATLTPAERVRVVAQEPGFPELLEQSRQAYAWGRQREAAAWRRAGSVTTPIRRWELPALAFDSRARDVHLAVYVALLWCPHTDDADRQVALIAERADLSARSARAAIDDLASWGYVLAVPHAGRAPTFRLIDHDVPHGHDELPPAPRDDGKGEQQ